MKILMMVFAALLMACASPVSTADLAAQAIKDQRWEQAYRLLEDGLVSNATEIKTRAHTLLERHPEILTAALNTFSSERLSNSIVRYGFRMSWEIEIDRLKIFQQIAQVPDYAIAKGNIEKSYADIYAQEKLKQELLAEKIAKEQSESARRASLKMQAQRSLELAAAKARFTCQDRLECDKAFSLTQIFIVNNSDMKIQVANDTVIETYNATEALKVAIKAIKMPRAGNTAEILLLISCRDESKESFADLCDAKSVRIYSEFPQFLQTNLIK